LSWENAGDALQRLDAAQAKIQVLAAELVGGLV
jgi:hypothetical protein